jgi:hypothetical protein
MHLYGTHSSDKDIISQGVPAMAACALAAGKTMMTVRFDLMPANAQMRANQRGSDSETYRNAELIIPQSETQVAGGQGLKPGSRSWGQ